jgi:aconitate hydratase
VRHADRPPTGAYSLRAAVTGQGLLARNAGRLGLTVKPWVKTTLSPGSRVVTEYLTEAGLIGDLAHLGFTTVGYGCMTCIGNSGPLRPRIEELVSQGITPVAVLSGNRNFPGRVHPRLQYGYLASPPLVVARQSRVIEVG